MLYEFVYAGDVLTGDSHLAAKCEHVYRVRAKMNSKIKGVEVPLGRMRRARILGGT